MVEDEAEWEVGPCTCAEQWQERADLMLILRTKLEEVLNEERHEGEND